jgi:hypothetical protein
VSTGAEGPDVPLDDIDAAILAQLRAVHARLDPPPPGLAEQVTFALELEDLDVEVAMLRDEALVGSGARGASRSRTLTFETDGLSLLISITELGEDQVRLDGWLAPADGLRVELRQVSPAAVRQVTPDEAGRFVFDGLRRGLVQLRLRPAAGAGRGRGVITPSIRL